MMAAKMPIIDPLNIIGEWIIMPTKEGIGYVESYSGSLSEGYYAVVYFGGESIHGALEHNWVSPEFIQDTIGVHVGTFEDMEAIMEKRDADISTK
jgi:hypothetical protein